MGGGNDGEGKGAEDKDKEGNEDETEADEVRSENLLGEGNDEFKGEEAEEIEEAGEEFTLTDGDSDPEPLLPLLLPFSLPELEGEC